MKKFIFLTILLVLFLSGCSASFNNKESELNIKNISMKLTSPDFPDNGFLPVDLTCDGEGRAPRLEINQVPANTVSLVLVADDPDAPAGTWTHWLVWNLEPETTVIEENNLPAGAVTGLNSGGQAGYYPACPPSGVHRYVFKLYALDKKLDLDAGAKAAELNQALGGHILDQTVLTGKYERKN